MASDAPSQFVLERLSDEWVLQATSSEPVTVSFEAAGEYEGVFKPLAQLVSQAAAVFGGSGAPAVVLWCCASCTICALHRHRVVLQVKLPSDYQRTCRPPVK